jgi:ribosome-associated translation inhibitor RaiA
MHIPLQVSFRHMEPSAAFEEAVREKVAKLEAFYPRLMSCRVAIEEEALHHQHGRLFNVRIDVHVPGHSFAITRDRNEDPYVALRDGFAATRRHIQDTLTIRRGTHS